MLNILDLIIIGLVFLIMIQSYRVGFLDEILSLAVFFLSGYFSYILYSYLMPYLDFISNNILIVKVCAIVVLFIAFYITGKIVKSFILDLINETELNGFDKIMGMILGFFKGVIIVTVLIFLFSYLRLNAVQNLINTSLISKKILYAVSNYIGVVS